jgi:transposase-like protein
MSDEINTLQQAVNYFSDPDKCLEFMTRQRWPNGAVTCPTCAREDVVFLKNQRKWQCKSVHPKRQFSVKVGTIFEDSPIGLDKWLCAVWLIANCRSGVSSYEIGRALGVTQKTAWFMLHRIRLAMQTGSFVKMGGGSGPVEVDETYIGGKARNMHFEKRVRMLGGGVGTVGKVAVIGLLQRHDKGNKVRLTTVQNTRREDIQPIVRKNVEAGSQLYTDSHSGYDGLKRRVLS